MEENRKVKTGVAIAGILLLIAIILYPEISNRIGARQGQEISLEQEPSLGTVEEPGEQKGKERESSLPQDSEMQEQDLEALSREQGLEVILGVGQGEQKLKVSLWQSDEGVCYFFLPGYARGMELTVEDVAEGGIQIGGTRICQGDILTDVLWERTYEMTLYDENDRAVLQAPLIFLSSSQLPVLVLETASGNTDAIDEDQEWEEKGSLLLLDEKGEKMYEGQMESMGGRGNSTWGLSKKPYQFKLSKKADLFGFGEAKSWNLLANGYDETKLRNRIVEELARKLGMAYVPQSQMVDVYINDIYYGNYFLTEKIQVGEERVAIRDMEAAMDALYTPEELEKLSSFENPEGTRRWVPDAYEDEDISGGYLFERELLIRFPEEVSGFMTTQGDCYVLKSPRYASENQVNYIGDLMQELQDALDEPDGVHPVTKKSYQEYIDLSSFIQKYLVEEISKNYDGGVTSSFFYKPHDEVSGKIYAGPVWDYDVVFGNCNLDEIASNPQGITRLNDHVYGTDLFARLYEKEYFYQQMTHVYRDRALPFLNELLEEGIDRMVQETRQSVRLDAIRWESLENRYQYYDAYDNNIRYLKYFIEKRTEFLNALWLEGEIYHNVTFVVDGEPWQIACIKDGEAPGGEPIPTRFSSLFIGWSTQEGIPYDPFKPIYEDMTFYSTWQELPIEEITLSPQPSLE